MEDVFSFLVIVIGAIITIISSANKKKQQQARTQYPPVVNTAPQHQARPAAAPAASMATMLPPRETPAQPTVHTHLAPDCDVHDASGSLNVISPEGKDPCHTEQLPASHAPLPETVIEPSLTLDWTGENLVKAFVMQEVLTRPSERRAR